MSTRQGTHDSRSNGDSAQSLLTTTQAIAHEINRHLADSSALQAACRRLVDVLSLDYMLVAHASPASTEAAILAEEPALPGQGGRLLLDGFGAYQRLQAAGGPVIIELTENGELGANRARFQPLQLRTVAMVPLLIQDNFTGFVMLGTRDANRGWSEPELAAVQAVASQLALALHTTGLLAEIQRRESQLSQLTVFGRLITSTLDRTVILQHVIEQVPNLLPAELLYVALLSAGQSRMKLITLSRSAPPQEDDLAAAGSSIEEVVQTQNPMLVADLQTTGYTDHRRMALQGLRSILTAPLTVSGRSFGAVMIGHSRAHLYAPTDMTLLLQIASQIAIALENARQFEVTRQRALYEVALSEITSHLQQQADLRVMLQQTMQDLGRVLGAHRARVRLQVVPPEAVQQAKSKE